MKQKVPKFWHIFLLISLMLPALLLQGCKSSNARTRAIKRAADAVKRDGAPKRVPKGALRTCDAIPRAEPLARCGNRFKKGTSNSYVALGKRYHVMHTSKGYRARGRASWYGTQFHGRKTSSGERYDMYQMTAAHPTLPLPSYVKVTNLHNGKCAIVKVNDRGPFHPDRILDVSYAAAHKLGILAPGTAHVEVVSVDPRDHGGHVPKHIHLKQYAPTLAGDPRIRHSLKNAGQERPWKKSSPSHQSPILKKRPIIEVRQPGTAAQKPAVLTPTLRPTPKATAPLPTTKKQPSHKVAKPTPKKPERIFLQLGTYSMRNKAEETLKKIQSLSKAPTSITKQGKESAPQFRIRIGPVSNHEEAIKLTQDLARARLPSPIVITEQP